MSRNLCYNNRFPCQCIQCLRHQIGRRGTCIYDFTSHLMRKPSSKSTSSTFSRLPSAIGSNKSFCTLRSQDIKLSTDIRSTRHHSLVVRLIPTDTCPKHQLVLAFLQERSNIVGHDLRTLTELANGRSQYRIRYRLTIDISFMITQCLVVCQFIGLS